MEIVLSNARSIYNFIFTDQVWHFLRKHAALSIAVVIGACFHSIRQHLSEHFLVTLEIPSKDDSFSCVSEWFNEQEVSKNSHQLLVETTYDPTDSESKPIVMFTPGIGYHWFTYKNKWVWLRRDRDANPDIAMGGHGETLTLTAIGTRKDIFRELVMEAVEFSQQKIKGKLVTYVFKSGSWQKFGQPDIPRPLKSVILDESLKKSLIEDVKKFFDSANWYKNLGIPWRRGYLLHGPPGCGKSSLIKALAGHFQLNICVANLNNRDIDDDELNALLNESPAKSIVVIEDIDVAMGSRDGDNRTSNLLTFHSQKRISIPNLFLHVKSEKIRKVSVTTNSILISILLLLAISIIRFRTLFPLLDDTAYQCIFLN
eukprot:TRINITY_DN2791_c0_g2_i1.p1 TRINITY_DN2791_c0_g2~~TRINITY_DN2791_c0_g2_i1.p1  ORF type:complete len:371 (+),score=15.19 TRINITY_DN2791_c0_g2_i1:15-1127(+)